jgi:hypothetical protein
MDYRVYMQQSRFWAWEFLVDLLGCLVPGLIFMFLAALVMVWPFARVYEHLIHDSQGGPEVRTQGQTMAEKGQSLAPGAPQNKSTNPSQDETAGGKERTSWEAYESLWKAFRAEVVILVIAFSYVFGFLFLSSDPRLPDARSVWASRKRIIADKAPAVYLPPEVKEDPGFVKRTAMHVIESFLGMRPRYIGRREKEGRIDVEFPYLNIKEYLLHRNLRHLADVVPWGVGDEKSRSSRTTAFINILKTRLAFALPNRCGNITRNEAHIRLMCSMWYMARLVQWLGLLSLCLVVLAALTVCPHYRVFERQEWEVSAPCLGGSALVVLAMWYVRDKIERNLHYQRVREILYVLETAYFATVCGIPISESGQQTRYPEILRDLGQKKDDSSNPPSSA